MREVAVVRWISVALTAVAAGCGGEQGSMTSFEVAAQGVYAGAIASNAEYGLIGSMNHGASLWRLTDRERLYNWNHKQGEYSELVAAAFSPDGNRAVTTDPRTLVLWDTTSGQALGFWTTPSTALDVAVSSDGHTVLIGQQDHSALLFDAESGEYVHTLLHEGKVYDVSITEDGSRALTASDDHTARIWDLESGKMITELGHSNPVRVGAISPQGSYAFTASQGQLVALWDAEDGRRLHTITTRNTGVTSAAFSADETHVLVGYVNRTVELWSVADGRRVARWRTSAKNPWHPTGTAVLAVGFGTYAGTYYALLGDGRIATLSGTS